MTTRKKLHEISQNVSYNEPTDYSDENECSSDVVDNNISEESFMQISKTTTTTCVREIYKNKNYKYHNQKNNKSENQLIVWIICTLVVGVAAGCLIFYLLANNETKVVDKCAFNALNAKYPKNQHIALEVSSIATILKDGYPTKAAVYLFLYNDTMEPEPFVSALADSVAQCFESEEGKLTLNDFKGCSHDYGCVIKEYVANNKKVLVINNLKEMPIEVVPSLHSICDTYDPMITPAFTFLTLSLSENYDKIKSAKNIANRELEQIWSAIDKNERLALIARVTDKVHFLNV